MAYTTGVSGSLSDLLTAIRSFAVAHAGFTDHYANRWTYTTMDTFQLSKNGVYYTFQYDTTTLNINTATSAGNAGAHTAQAGASGTFFARPRPLQGPHIGYWLFNGGVTGVGPCVHVVVEIVNGVFIHFSFGEIEKQGAYTGGQYVTCSYQTTAVSGNNLASPVNGFNTLPWTGISSAPVTGGHIRTPVGVASWGSFANGAPAAVGSWASNIDSAGQGQFVLARTFNTFNNRAPLFPIDVMSLPGLYSAAITAWVPMGHVVGAAGVNTRALDAKQVVLTDWQVFPVFEKNGAGTSYVNGLYYGVAYKR